MRSHIQIWEKAQRLISNFKSFSLCAVDFVNCKLSLFLQRICEILERKMHCTDTHTAHLECTTLTEHQQLSIISMFSINLLATFDFTKNSPGCFRTSERLIS